MSYLIALSGGADSVALLLKMKEEGRAGAAAHCNFHLRGAESERDEAFVRQLCAAQGVRLFVAQFDTAAEAARTGESVEMAARRLRYGWFEELCRTHGFEAVAVGHHREDNAETLLLNLVRGTGLHGLTGMPPAREGVVRPLLGWDKADILRFLAERGQDFVTDSTNADTHYRRNFIRHKVLPLLQSLNPQIVPTLCDTARRLGEAESICQYALRQLREKLITPLPDGLRLDRDALLAAPAPATLLHEWLAPYGFTEAQTQEAAAMRSGALLEAGDWLLTRTSHTLEMRRRPQPVAPQAVPAEDGVFFEQNGLRIGVRRLPRRALGDIPRSPSVAVLDAGKLDGPLTLRPVSATDRFRPFGMAGTQLVSDFLTNHHRSRIDKLAALAICDRAGIVWLVDERPAARAAVGNDTEQIVMFYSERL